MAAKKLNTKNKVYIESEEHLTCNSGKKLKNKDKDWKEIRCPGSIFYKINSNGQFEIIGKVGILDSYAEAFKKVGETLKSEFELMRHKKFDQVKVLKNKAKDLAGESMQYQLFGDLSEGITARLKTIKALAPLKPEPKKVINY